VKSISAFKRYMARSTRDLLNTLAATGAARPTFRSLHDAWTDTTTPTGS
jgi:hypothetical protein